jgi:DNA-binding NarL/FixJ family response regulator
LAALGHEIPSDFVSLNGIAPDPALNWSLAQPTVPKRYYEAFAQFALQNPLAEWHLRTRDGRPLRLSDIITAEQLHATDLYREVYAEIGVEYQIAFTLPSPSERIVAIALSRTHQDYSDTERDLLALARPHLIQAYRNVLEVTDRRRRDDHSGARAPDEGELQSLGLTPAQARVLRRIAMGFSTDGVARELAIAPRTVHKHLERIYARLGVTDRAGAAERAWAAAGTTPTGA